MIKILRVRKIDEDEYLTTYEITPLRADEHITSTSNKEGEENNEPLHVYSYSDLER